MWPVKMLFEKRREGRGKVIYTGGEGNQKTVPCLLLSVTKTVLYRFSLKGYGLVKTSVKTHTPRLRSCMEDR